jgi:hypothetical protein
MRANPVSGSFGGTTPQHGSAAAAGLPHRRAARRERGPAAEPGEERYGGVGTEKRGTGVCGDNKVGYSEINSATGK